MKVSHGVPLQEFSCTVHVDRLQKAQVLGSFQVKGIPTTKHPKRLREQVTATRDEKHVRGDLRMGPTEVKARGRH